MKAAELKRMWEEGVAKLQGKDEMDVATLLRSDAGIWQVFIAGEKVLTTTNSLLAICRLMTFLIQLAWGVGWKEGEKKQEKEEGK